MVKIVHSGVLSEVACEIERQLIKEYGRIDSCTGCLLNKTDGGEGASGVLMTPERVIKIRNAVRNYKKKLEYDAVWSYLGSIFSISKNDIVDESNDSLVRLIHSPSKSVATVDLKGRDVWIVRKYALSGLVKTDRFIEWRANQDESGNWQIHLRCPSCSKKVGKNDKFCVHCGAPLANGKVRNDVHRQNSSGR